MTWRLSLIFLIGLNGCELLPNHATKQPERDPALASENAQERDIFCVSDTDDDTFEYNCNIAFWLNYRSKLETLNWQKRKEEIERLKFDPNAMLKKILLSQGKDTPYKDRLRAQNWIESLYPQLTNEMRQFLAVMVYQPSQDLLELESALVTLGRVNSNLSQSNEEQKLMIEKQKSQIEQLLKIEASIMANGNGDNL
jgi:hypothetical protein